MLSVPVRIRSYLTAFDLRARLCEVVVDCPGSSQEGTRPGAERPERAGEAEGAGSALSTDLGIGGAICGEG
jgi:hypothetical protein